MALYTVGGYTLSADAVKALQMAKTGDAAERAFNAYADYVPRKHRGRVWQAVDNVTIF